MNWTQPCCGDCFIRRNPGHVPTRVLNDDIQRCCHCGRGTDLGIYIRVDPRTVRYPREDHE